MTIVALTRECDIGEETLKDNVNATISRLFSCDGLGIHLAL